MWKARGVKATNRHFIWSREVYDNMTPFSSKLSRSAYVDYRNLGIGLNDNEFWEGTSYKEASIWGLKYFWNNFKRLVQVKTKFDPYVSSLSMNRVYPPLFFSYH